MCEYSDHYRPGLWAASWIKICMILPVKGILDIPVHVERHDDGVFSNCDVKLNAKYF